MSEREVSYTVEELRARAKEREGLTYGGLTYLQAMKATGRDPLVSDQTIAQAEALARYGREEAARGEQRERRDREDGVLLETVTRLYPQIPLDTLFDMIYRTHTYTIHRFGKRYRLTVDEVVDE